MDFAAQIPTATAAAALLAVGAAFARLKGVIVAIDELRRTVEKLSDNRLGKVEDRILAIEKWQAGHEQQATERWRELKGGE